MDEILRRSARQRRVVEGRVADPNELRKLTAFFTWAAWGSVAQRPGRTHSYTNNFPYDPLAGTPHRGALLWTAISFIFLLGGIAVVLLAFGKFDYLGWHGTAPLCSPTMGR